MPTIRIDDEVYAWLQSRAKPFEDTPNNVLRRLMPGGAAGQQRNLLDNPDGGEVPMRELSDRDIMNLARMRLVKRIVEDLRRKTEGLSIEAGSPEEDGKRFALKCSRSKRFAVIRPFRPRLGVTSVNVALEMARAAGIPPGVPQKVERGRWFGQDGLRLDIPTEGQGYNEAIYQEVLNFLERLMRLL